MLRASALFLWAACLLAQFATTPSAHAATAGVTSSGNNAYPNGGMLKRALVTNFAHADYASCAIVNTSGTRAWIGCNTMPGVVAQIDLATMRQTGSLELFNPAFGTSYPITAGAIDPASKYGYFITPGTHNLYRVDLATLKQSALLNFVNPGTPQAILIDPAGKYCYIAFSTFSTAGSVVRVDLGTFTVKDQLTLPASEINPNLIAIDTAGTFAYVLSNNGNAAASLTKIQLSDFTRVDSLVLTTADGINSITVDPTGSFVYATERFGSTGIIYRIHVGLLATYDTLKFPSGAGTVQSFTLINAGARAIGLGNDNRLTRVNLNTFTYMDTSDAAPYASFSDIEAVPGTVRIPGSGEHILIYNNIIPAVVEKMDLATFPARGPFLALAGGERPTNESSLLLDADSKNAYLCSTFGCTSLSKIDLQKLTRTTGTVMEVDGHSFITSAGDGRYGYFGTTQGLDNSYGVRQVELASLAPANSASFSDGQEGIESMAYNPFNQKIYFSTDAFSAAAGAIVSLLAPGLTQYTPLSPYTNTQTVLDICADPTADGFYFYLSPNSVIGHYHGTTDYSSAVFPAIRSLAKSPLSDNLYAATYSASSAIVYELNPTTLDVSRSLDFNSLPGIAVSSLTDGVIDHAGQFAYYNCFTQTESALLRTGLDSLSSADILPASSDILAALTIDPDNRWLYAIDEANPISGVAKIGLTPREHLEGTRFHLNETAQVNDVQFYANTNVGARRLDVRPLGYTDQAAPSDIECGFLDNAHHRAWFGTAATPGWVVAFDTQTRNVVTSRSISPLGGLIGGACDPDGTFGYFADNTVSSQIEKVRLSDATFISTLNLDPGTKTCFTAAITPNGQFAYFGDTDSPAHISKIRLSDFTLVGTLTLGSGEDNIKNLAIDPTGGFLYAACDGPSGFTHTPRVVKVSLTSFTDVAAVFTSDGYVAGLAVDATNTFLYASGGSATHILNHPAPPGVVDRIRLSDFTLNQTLQLGAKGVNPEKLTLAPNGQYMLVACNTGPNFMNVIDVASFSESGGGTLRSNTEVNPYCMMIDASSQFAYLGMDSNPGRIVTFEPFPKPLRIGLYRDFGADQSLVWQSTPQAVTVNGDWMTIPVTQGTPPALKLPAGHYTLAWQSDADQQVPSYAPGAYGEGLQLAHAFGNFPSGLDLPGTTNGSDTSTSWTTTASRWSAFIDYTPHNAAHDWQNLR